MKISENEIRETLLRSGYLFESRISKTLKENGFFVELNKTFYDNRSEKSREIDIIADNYGYDNEKGFEIACKTILLIEAKNISIPLVFFKGISKAISELPDYMRYISDSNFGISDYFNKVNYKFYHYFHSFLST